LGTNTIRRKSFHTGKYETFSYFNQEKIGRCTTFTPEDEVQLAHIPKEFTDNEDAIIVMHVEKYGYTWKDISNKLPGRSPLAIENRCKVLLKKCNIRNSFKKKAKKRVNIVDRKVLEDKSHIGS